MKNIKLSTIQPLSTPNSKHSKVSPAPAVKVLLVLAVLASGALLPFTVQAQNYYPDYPAPLNHLNYPETPLQGGAYPMYNSGASGGAVYQTNPIYQSPSYTNIPPIQTVNPQNSTQLARVISATPIVAQKDNYVDVCAPGQVVRPNPTGGGALLGAVAGGLIGNSIGGYGRYDHWGNYHYRNNGAGAAIGAIGGALVGNSIEAQNNPSYYRPPQCYTQNNARPVVSGYNVQYELNGQIYSTQTLYHPGEWLSIQDLNKVKGSTLNGYGVSSGSNAVRTTPVRPQAQPRAVPVPRAPRLANPSVYESLDDNEELVE